MPNHKFLSDLEAIENSNSTEPISILIVGTFNGITKNNSANWFYGRPQSEFWYLLPKAMGYQSLYPSDIDKDPVTSVPLWKKFCQDNNIVIVDLLKQTSKEILNHSDSQLADLTANECIFFDFGKAFQKRKVDKLFFTWKDEKNEKRLVQKRKLEMLEYFKNKGTGCYHLESPSPNNQKGRYEKLIRWKEAFTHAQKTLPQTHKS